MNFLNLGSHNTTTQGDYVGTAVIVTWTTPHAPGPNKVTYWSENCKEKKKVEGKIVRYTFYNNTPGFIHHANILLFLMLDNLLFALLFLFRHGL